MEFDNENTRKSDDKNIMESDQIFFSITIRNNSNNINKPKIKQ